MSDGSLEHAGSCYCSSVKVFVTGHPVQRGFAIFLRRKWHSARINALCVFPKDNVRIEGELTVSQLAAEVIMEAMEIEHAIKVPGPGAVSEIYFSEGDLVDCGVDLLAFVPE